MAPTDFVALLEFARSKTRALLDAVAALPNPARTLAWQPGPGRANIAWQLMHIGATDDRHLHVRMRGGEPHNPEYVQRFGVGSVPSDDVPPLEEIARYLGDRRAAMLDHLKTLTVDDMAKKPNEKAPWVYGEWFQVLAWHEAHHHGQAHLTLNLFNNSAT